MRTCSNGARYRHKLDVSCSYKCTGFDKEGKYWCMSVLSEVTGGSLMNILESGRC